jgi:hypothetical protein
MIQIRQPQNDLATERFSVPLAHLRSVHAADVHKLEQVSVSMLGSLSAQAISYSSTTGGARLRIRGHYLQSAAS